MKILIAAFSRLNRQKPSHGSDPAPKSPEIGLCKAVQRRLGGLCPKIRTSIFNLGSGVQVIAINEAEATDAIAAINEGLSPDNDWVRITPFKELPNSVGLQVVDRQAADAMVAAFNSLPERAARLFRGLPVYVGHPDDAGWARQNPSTRAEAVGRIKELETRNDGLYGRVAWNEEGKRLISGDAAAYAFHSPRWSMRAVPGRPKAFRPELLHSIGLTNHPNIPNLPVGLNEAERAQLAMNKKAINNLLRALGRPALTEDATDEQYTTALNEALPAAQSAINDQAALAGVRIELVTAQNEGSTLTSTNERLTQQVTELTTQAANERASRADLFLQIAVNEGRITEADKPAWKTKLTADGADFDKVSGEVSKLKPALNTKAPGVGDRKGEGAPSSDVIDAINEKVAAYKLEHECDHHTAYLAVKKANPDLFEAKSDD